MRRGGAASVIAGGERRALVEAMRQDDLLGAAAADYGLAVVQRENQQRFGHPPPVHFPTPDEAARSLSKQGAAAGQLRFVEDNAHTVLRLVNALRAKREAAAELCRPVKAVKYHPELRRLRLAVGHSDALEAMEALGVFPTAAEREDYLDEARAHIAEVALRLGVA